MPTVGTGTATARVRAARDFLLNHREDYATAYRDYRQPVLESSTGRWIGLTRLRLTAAIGRRCGSSSRRRRDPAYVRRAERARTRWRTGCASTVLPAATESRLRRARHRCWRLLPYGRRRQPRRRGLHLTSDAPTMSSRPGLPDLAVRARERADRTRGGGTSRRARRAGHHALCAPAAGFVQARTPARVRRAAEDNLWQDPPGRAAHRRAGAPERRRPTAPSVRLGSSERRTSRSSAVDVAAIWKPVRPGLPVRATAATWRFAAVPRGR
jgi:hypothetical protein